LQYVHLLPLSKPMILMKKASCFLIVLLSITLLSHSYAGVFTVTNTNHSGAGSLRQAITDANTNSGADEIRFNISGAGPFVLDITTALPVITESLNIRGYTQPGSWNGSNASRNCNIFLTNSGSSTHACFEVSGNAGTFELSGIMIGGFKGPAVYSNGASLTRLFVWGCSIGTNASGSSVLANEYGIKIDNNSTIANFYTGTDGNGSNDWAEANVISGHTRSAIYINNATVTNSLIAYNFIGLLKDGVTEAPNCTGATGQTGAIHLSNTSNINIGTDANGTADWQEGNIIAATRITGETSYTTNPNGVFIDNCTNITVAGNYIGTSEDGETAKGNHGRGVQVNNSQNIFIGYNDAKSGGNAWATKNVISGNKYGGIGISNCTNVFIANNYVGTDKDGVADIGNGDAVQQTGNGITCEGVNNGLYIGMDSDNTNDSYQINYICFNKLNGVYLNTSNVYVAGNRIGVDGSYALAGNAGDGIRVDGGRNIIIGSNADNRSDNIELNYIGGNGGNGISFYNSNKNKVSGNYIGCINDGSTGLRPNAQNGIYAFQSDSLVIGSNATASSFLEQRNYINGSGQNGIYFHTVRDAYLCNNFIGTSTDGAFKRPNTQNGIYFVNCQRDTIGTNNDNINDALERNIVSGNGMSGIRIEGTGNVVNDFIWMANNFIGSSSSGDYNLGNGLHGIYISNAKGTIIGTNGNGVSDNDNRERNIIGYNISDGIHVENGDSTRIANNYIGLTSSGQFNNANQGNGINIINSRYITIGTNSNNVSDDDERNTISNNGANGIRFEGVSQSFIRNNYIGTASWGVQNYGNQQNGIYLLNSFNNIIGTNGDNVQDVLEKNTVANNTEGGIALTGSYNNIIANCYVGVGNDGGTVHGNGHGIVLTNSYNNRVGTNADGVSDFPEVNVVSGNLQYGIVLSGAATTGNTISGNYIGISKFGAVATPNANAGFVIENGAYSNIIGSDAGYTGSGDRQNIIANNGKGLVIRNSNTRRNRISYNSFYANGGPAIDLGDFDGVTPNNGTTAANLPNIDLDYPVITRYEYSSGTITLTGYVGNCSGVITNNGTVVTGPLTIEVYRADNSPADQDGPVTISACGTAVKSHGEGRQYLGRFAITTGVFTNVSFTSLHSLTAIDSLTAIAIDADGNTSEFGAFYRFALLPNNAKLQMEVTAKERYANHVTWSFTGDNEVAYYTVQKSGDASLWSVMETVSVNYRSQVYTAVDKQVQPRIFYRVTAHMRDGKTMHSEIKKMERTMLQPLAIYPSVTNSTTTVYINNPFQQATVSVMDASGRVVLQKRALGASVVLSGLEALPRGLYAVTVIADGVRTVQKLLLQ
jgi:parallel beta-helix repeat protein